MMRRTLRLGVILTSGLVAAFLLALTIANWPSIPLPSGVKATRVSVYKSARKLVLLDGERVLKTYRIALGPTPQGPKTQDGDDRTPEGEYRIDGRNPESSFHLSLHISYPDEDARQQAARRGVDAGGEIMIHGLRNGLGWLGGAHRVADWTRGCIAVTNPEIEEIWRVVPDGTPIEIRP
jgi:murein L,D-transpeptidase YafK